MATDANTFLTDLPAQKVPEHERDEIPQLVCALKPNYDFNIMSTALGNRCLSSPVCWKVVTLWGGGFRTLKVGLKC